MDTEYLSNAENTMRTVNQTDSPECIGKSSVANSKSDDETAYLLKSKANAKRLLNSIDNLRAGTTSARKPMIQTETPIL